jgi:holo-[acyl-carrier protein] synthase
VIFGIGTDIVRVQRLQSALDRHGERLARRILAEEEFDEFQDSLQQGHFLAKRFAAKEATVKALGTGFRDGISLRDIRVGHDSLGKPLLLFSEAVAARLAELGVADNGHISLSDEREFAVAFVVLERQA